MTQLYCIKHNEIVYLEKTNKGTQIHAWGGEFSDEYCEFLLGYAFCAPPQGIFDDFILYEEWSRWCVDSEPSPAELEISNAQAKELLTDFDY